MRIVTNQEMRELDQTAIDEIGIPSTILMENAGLEAARLMSQICKQKNYEGEILVFCGKGKNGGDGLVVARRLLSDGHRVRIFLLHDASEYSGESALQLKILKNMRARISVLESANVLEEYFNSANPPFFVVDALLGTGLKRAIEGLYYDTINQINEHADEVLSLDIPSGVSGDTGEIMGTAIQATHTVSFGYPKLGHFLSPQNASGAARRGKLYHVDLCFPKSWLSQGDKFLLTNENTAPKLNTRDKYGHKNSFGHCLLIGGSPGRLGAIVMSSNSCLKMGTGLVTVASWEESFPSLEVKLSSEIMNFRISEFKVPAPGLSQFSCVVVGPGLGTSSKGVALIKELFQTYQGPIVVDADGLNLIAENNLHHLLQNRSEPTVITPHPGEMARLLKVSKEQVVANPIESIRAASEKTGAIIVLKGATSLIHSSSEGEGVTWFNHYPNDGMATAGSGDVLSGMIGGLLGQKMSGIEATKLGVYLHSLAGKYASENCGHRAMTALDIIENIKHAFKEMREFKPLKFSSSCVEMF